MSELVRRKKVDNEIEMKIVTGAIVSTPFCAGIRNVYNPKFMKVSYARKVLEWCLEYYDKYSRAPEKHITDIFKIEVEDIKSVDADLIETFLSNLSEAYEEGFYRDESFNSEYLLDQSRKYFEERSLELLFEQGQALVSAGKVAKAKYLLDGHRQVVQKTTDRFNPFDENTINEYDVVEEQNRVMKFGGRIGDLLGWFERDWLVSFTAPEKRGKSWFLEETAIHGIQNRRKVLLITLEMSKKTMLDRIYKRITGLPDERKKIVYPVFDCLRNQEDSCRKKTRTNDKPFPIDIEDICFENFTSSKYKVCTSCRGKKRKRGFVPSVWYTSYKAKKMTKKDIKSKSRHIINFYGDLLRVKTFPAFSANTADIVAELDDLEYTEGFIPDIIAIDYVDILAPEDGRLSERGNIDMTWKKFKNLAAVRHSLVVTADQSNKASNDRETIKATDTSEDKRKNAHVDVKLGMNQTPDEKEQGVMRISVLLNRHHDYSPKRQAVVLQNLEIAQPVIDSEIIILSKKKDEGGGNEE